MTYFPAPTGPGGRLASADLPDQAGRARRSNFARDGFALLGAVHDPSSPTWLRELSAVQVLRTVLVQNYTRTTARRDGR